MQKRGKYPSSNGKERWEEGEQDGEQNQKKRFQRVRSSFTLSLSVESNFERRKEENALEMVVVVVVVVVMVMESDEEEEEDIALLAVTPFFS